MVVDVADKPVDPEGPWWVRAIPDAPGPIVVRFRDPRGRPIGETKFPPVSPPAAPPPSDSFEIPTFGQGGHPVAVSGPFTGDPSATAVTVDGRDTPFLAQSPRQTLVRLPADVEGPVELRVAEGDTVATAPFRVVGVRLSADKLDLKRGERTALHVEVRGLDGLDEPVPLTVTNSSPSVIQLEGGESERVTIHPDEVAPGGTVTLDRSISSLRAGGFSIEVLAGPAGRRAVPIKKDQDAAGVAQPGSQPPKAEVEPH